MSKEWSSPGYWEHFYEIAETPWELGEVSPVLKEAVAEVQSFGESLANRRLLIPGCGSGADAVWLASQGASVIAIDFSVRALAQVETRLSGLPGDVRGRISLQRADFFEGDHSAYDFVAEHTFFCAIDPASRPRYAQAVAKALKPGGILFGNFFVLPEEEIALLPSLALRHPEVRPPFVASERELRGLFLPNFELLTLRQARHPSPDRRPGLEWVGVFRRKKSSLAA